MANLAKPLPSDLGFFASAIETHPVATLTVTGASLGIALGVASGLLFGLLFDRKNLTLNAVKSGGIAGAAFGLLSYSEGLQLESWLKNSESSPGT